ncbi:MAG: amino acid adenylation domain-containing protein, partial [Bacteroidota bacterium]
AFSSLLAEQGVTVLNQTPSFFRILQQKILQDPNYETGIRYIIFGGEKLKPAQLKGWNDRYPNCKLINMYGITETTVHVTYKEITHREIESGVSNIGIPIPTLGSIILDPDQKLVPKNVAGELYIYGGGVARGYLNRDELTADRFIILDIPKIGHTKCYRTGDLARILDNGELEYLGRIDTQIKIRGFRIELGEIEAAVLSKDSIREAVILVETQGDDHTLIAYFISDEEETVASMQQYLSHKLPEYMHPSYFVQLKAFPLTPNGKLDRKALPSPNELELATGVEYTAPRSEMELQIAQVWQQVLQRNKVGINDSYFALGGDSIKAISVIIEMNKILPVTIGVADLYMHPTIEEIADHILNIEHSEQRNDHSQGYAQIKELEARILEEDKDKGMLPRQFDAIYPMVPIEEGMIYSSLLRPEEPIYIDRFVYSVAIEDIDMLRRAMKQLIDRHPILRNQYFMEQFSQPIKVVLSDAEVPMTLLDFSELPDDEVDQRLTKLKEDDLAYRYTFDGQLLYNFRFVRITGQQYIVVWNFHHAILDGWSTSVFIQELTVLLSNAEERPLPELPYSYIDYCAGVLSRKSSEATAAYWQAHLEGYTRNKLPFNFKGVRIGESIGMTTVTRIVEEPVLRKLEQLSEEFQVSFKAICLAAHAYLMRIICSEEDVVTGVVSHERPELERSDRIMGCFLNTVPMRMDFSNIKNSSALVKKVNEYLIASKQHEVHVSHIARSIGEKATLENPIFDTILNYTHFHVYEEAASDSGIDNAQATVDDALMVSDEMTNTLFDVEVSRRTNGLELRIKYVPALFTAEDAQAGLQLFANILGLFIDKGPLTPQLVMEKVEFDELVYQHNNTVVEEEQNVLMHELFEAQCLATPNNTALIQDGRELTYEALNIRSNQLAHYLKEQGISSEINVGVLCTRSFDMIIALFGILKAGGSYVPIDPDYPIQRQQYIVENSKVDIILTNQPQGLEDTMAEKQFINIAQQQWEGNEWNPEPATRGDRLAYTIYTSGSTGNPKGVMIEHYSAVNLIRWVNERFQISEKDRMLFITSVCFDLSVYDIFGMLASGGSIVIARKEEVQNFDQLKQLMLNERITFWDSVPTTFNYLVDELEEEENGALLPDLRLVFMSGDWIPVALPDRARKFFPNAEIISLGGATEGTVWSNYFPIQKVGAHWSSIPYGVPIRNNFFYVLDDQLCPVPTGTVGELFIGGIGVARGYDNDLKKTKAAFMPDPFNKEMGGRMYKTGDLGRWMRNGNMEFIGRKDNQVKIRGFRVELGEIESTLTKHETIKEAIVSAVQNSKGQNQLCAYLVATSEYDNESLKTYLRDRLPDYMIPSFYVLLDALPLNSNGKIDRKALPDVSHALTADNAKYVAPSTETEKRITAIVERIIDENAVSVASNFFDLGFNSLSLMRMANAI